MLLHDVDADCENEGSEEVQGLPEIHFPGKGQGENKVPHETSKQ